MEYNEDKIQEIDERFRKLAEEEGYEVGNTLNDVTSIEDELLNNEWIEEAKQIPLNKLSKVEQEYITKCINKQIITDDEKEAISEILAKCRPALEKYQPQETLENLENNIQYNNDEKSFLQLLKQQKKEKTLTMNYPLDDGSTYKLELIIERVDSQAVLQLQENFKIFEDLTQQEKNIKSRNDQGYPITREEAIILESLEKKINKKLMANQEEMMIEFLSEHTKIKNEEYNYDYMKQIYQTMDPVYMESLFNKVGKISGLTTPKTDELFQ